MRISAGYQKLIEELVLFAAINGGFFILSALLLWPFGRAAMSGQLAKGFVLFLAALALAVVLGIILRKAFRIEEDPPADAFVIMNIILSGVVQMGWTAFTALAAGSHASGASWIAAGVVYLVGLIASWLSTMLTGGLFQGTIYRTINSLISLIGFLFFAFLPGVTRSLFGWFFAWF